MKNATFNIGFRFVSFPVFCFFFLLCTSPIIAQSNLTDDGAQHTVSYNGSYQDFLIPSNVTYGQIKLTARGADGGRRNISAYNCSKKGGGGATAVATFNIGCDLYEISPGSTIRFIVGHEGTSNNSVGVEGGGGGGGTGVLCKAPGSEEWVLLAVGGGGGGAYMNGFCSGNPGGNGRIETSGGNAGSDGIGGENGNGGTSDDAAGGGGGALTSSESADDCETGGGELGGTVGGDGGRIECDWYSAQRGGFGFGAGGAGLEAGGGGGGYSGGAGGNTGQRGGGGGSYVNSMAASSTLTAGTTTNSPDAGWCYYQFLSNTGSPIASVTAVCQAVTATIDNWPNSTSVTISAVQMAGNSTVTCGTLGYSVQNFTFTDAQLYTTVPTTVTVTDGLGNSSSCVSQVTVTTSIVAKCKNITAYLSNAGSVTVQASQVNNGSYDPDGDPVTASFFLIGASITLSCAQLGTNQALLWVNDANDEAGYCFSTITVKDVNAPSVTCKSAVLSLDANGQATLNPSDVYYSGYDNCSITSKTVSPSTFNCSNRGLANLVTLTVSDATGNTKTCTTNVYVNDITPPTITCKNATVSLNASGSASITPTTVYNTGSDACGSINLNWVSPSSFTCSNIGANTVTLNVGDGFGNQTTCTATVTIKDNTAPTITCRNATVYLNASGAGSIAPTDVYLSGSDNCGSVNLASVTPSSFNCTLGGQTVTLTANDGNGNTATCAAVVTVKDEIAPTAACQNTTVQLNAQGSVTVTASSLTSGSSDNCAIMTRIPSSTTYTATGTYSYSITLKDAPGNSSSCTSQVTVQSYNGFGGGGDRNHSETGSTEPLGFSIFPNPTGGEANVRFDLPANQPFVLEVLDMQGKKVLSQEGVGMEGENIFTLHTSDFVQGIYLVHFQSGELRSQKRLVVQK